MRLCSSQGDQPWGGDEIQWWRQFCTEKDNFTISPNKVLPTIQENMKDADNWRDKSTDENG